MRYEYGAAPDLSGTVVFDDVAIDLDQFTITRGGQPSPVEPQVFDVLRFLLERRERVVTKEELFDGVWGTRFVSESALSSRVKSARQATGDNGRRQQVIRTAHGKGYQFVARAEVVAPGGPAPPSPRTPAVDQILAPTKPLVGRESLLSEVKSQLQLGRVVTLVGPGGVGKSLLAHHTAVAVASRFRAGSWQISLAPVTEPDLVAQAVLDAMGHRRLAGQSAADALTDAARDRPALILLDNCEHQLGAVAETVARLRAGGDEVTILATSRQRLGVPGEQLITVPVLTPNEALELFAQRAEEADVRLDLRSGEVGEICELLDRLPLALELAGARTRVLGVKQLLALLDERMALLVSSGETEGHHVTLEQTIASSFDALDDGLRQTLCRFSLFPGLFDLDAASALARVGTEWSHVDAVHQVMGLAERSLLVVVDVVDTPRYRLLESVRLFCARRLQDRDEVEATLASFFCQRAEERRRQLFTDDYDELFDDLDAEWPSYRAAFEVSLERGWLDEAAGLALAVLPLAELQLRFELGDWFERLVAAAGPAPSTTVAEAKAGLARFLAWQGDLDRAQTLADEAGSFDQSLTAGVAQAWVLSMRGERDRADKVFAQLLEVTGQLGGLYELIGASMVNRYATNTGADAGGASERIRRRATSGGPISRTFLLHADVHEALQCGDYARALPLCEELTKTATLCGLTVLALGSLTSRALALQHTQDPREQAAHVLHTLEHYRRSGQWISLPVEAEVAAHALANLGHPEPAAEILGGAVAQAYRAHGLAYADAVADQLREALDERFESAYERGRHLSPAALCHRIISELAPLVEQPS